VNPHSALVSLLRRAYEQGWQDGDRYDPGCQVEDFGRFDGFLKSLAAHEIVSGVAELADQGAPLTPGAVVTFEAGDFVVESLARTRGETHVELVDRASYERVRRF